MGQKINEKWDVCDFLNLEEHSTAIKDSETHISMNKVMRIEYIIFKKN